MTNRGLVLTVILCKDTDADGLFRAVLACGDNVQEKCVLRLEQCSDGTYRRVAHSESFSSFHLDVDESSETICIQHITTEHWLPLGLSNYRITVKCLSELSILWMATVDTTKTEIWKPPFTNSVNASRPVITSKEVYVRSAFFLALEMAVKAIGLNTVNFGLAIKRCKDSITLIGWRCDHVSTSRTVINRLRGFKPPPSQKRDTVYLPLAEGLNFKAVLRPSGFKSTLSVPVITSRTLDAFALSFGFQEATFDDAAQKYFGPPSGFYDEASKGRLIEGIRIY